MEKRGITKEFDDNDDSFPEYKEDLIDDLSKRVVKQIKKATDDNADTTRTTEHN